MVSNLSELSRALRDDAEPNRSFRGADFMAAFRSDKSRIVSELQQSGEAEVRDSQGNVFIIRRKKS